MDGERGPLWIRSDAQETGRGRSGRPWSSPPGNLSATYLFTPTSPRAVYHQLSFVTGVAAFDAITPNVPETAGLQLKWPNDVLIADAKIGGILIESSVYERDAVVMIGIGINIRTTPAIEDRAITRLTDHGNPPGPSELLLQLNACLTRWLEVWNNGAGFTAIREAWLARAHPIGHPLTVNTTKQHLEGTFAGLAENGALLLATPSGETRCIEHGDVSLASAPRIMEKRA